MPRMTVTAPVSARMPVLLPLPLAGPYTYRMPAALGAKPGDFVLVPLGPRRAVGVVWGGEPGPVDEARLKAAAARLDAPPMPESLRRFVDRVADYTLAAPGAVLRMCMSVPAALERPPSTTAWRLAGTPPGRLTPARRKVIALLSEGPSRTAREIAELTATGPGVVQGLAAAGVLEAVTQPPPAPFARPDPLTVGVTLSPAQAAAAAELAGAVGAKAFAVHVLDGVTGSGKTETYFEAIAAALTLRRQALVLLPEIALTPQWLDRFATRFGARPAIWHSELSTSERRRTWRAVADGQAHVVVGARSALFLPFPDLGVIVVDEEHDGSYKQEDGVIYQARDMAVLRAKLASVPAVLVSATPSLETVVNVERGRYRRVHLPERHGAALMPLIAAIDLRRDPPPPRRFLSPALAAALTETLGRGEQALLFLNRRGYAPLTLCGACGHRLGCPHCSTWLVEHRRLRRLLCHHCGHMAPMPGTCPSCGAEDHMRPCGPGVERLAEEVSALWPDARQAVMASDTMGGPAAAAELVRRIVDRRVDVVIGTQIVAKGHHFPLLTLVGVIDADLGLGGGDLRAGERTYQLLTHVAGRAGRADLPGRAFLQTFMPEHPLMQALVKGDAVGFLAAESASRRAAGMPPFGRLAALIVSGPDEAAVAAAARALGQRAPHDSGVSVLGPAPAPLSLLRGRFRHRLLLKCTREVDMQAVLRAWLKTVPIPRDLRLAVDVDPYSFL